MLSLKTYLTLVYIYIYIYDNAFKMRYVDTGLH